MGRLVSTCVAVLVIAASASLRPASEARAAPAAGAICKSFSLSGLKYQWSVIGSVTCKKAKPWLLKLLAVRGKPGAQMSFRNGPKGFHCSATADSKGRASAGACYTGTLAFPKNGFQWFG
jgi:hypothetical protein